jgi:hypothetical protein
MKAEIETTIYTKENVRVSVSDHDDGVWLHLGLRHGTAYAVLNHEEAERLMAGLQAILAQEVAA